MSKIKFERDYIFRNCRTVTSTPDIALTELVANSWDAGALNVEISLPTNDIETTIKITDDGCGMSREEFYERWMTLNYNRREHQGENVVFPSDISEKRTRIAYGRNGIGRHGMLCFSDTYTVETWKDGKGFCFKIGVTCGEEPYSILSDKEFKKEGHGTTIYTSVDRNHPDIKKIKEILSARFIYDPQFSLVVNGEKLDLSSNGDVIKEKEIVTKDGVHLLISIVDSTKTANNSRRHGVAFWVRGRLVGNPAWSYQRWQFLDARCKVAKRYTIIVQTDDVINDVLPEWTGFYDTPKMNNVFQEIDTVITEFMNEVMEEQITELKNDIILEKRDTLETMTLSEKRDISSYMNILTQKNPMVATEILSTSVDAIIQIQQAKKGTELLKILSKMRPEDLDNLTELLTNWDVNDIVSVIDEIDRRILVIEAISRVCDDKDTDELHTLHPLVLQAKWLFGAEFDSPMFASNKTLNTIMRELFKESDYDKKIGENLKKRPDIVCLNDMTIRAVCTEKIDTDAGEIMKPDQILIIELKKGGFEVGIKEVSQTENYMHQIKKAKSLHKDATIHSFVVGANIGDIAVHKKTEDGILDVVTYGILVQTARLKLFKLREKLAEHYNSIGDESLIEKVLKEPRQMKFSDYKKNNSIL